MALQSNNFLDIANQTQTLTYTLNSVQVDQLSFSSNQITFGTISPFTLIKSDVLLYVNYLNLFLNTLINNFPSIQNYRSISLPSSSFDITLSLTGAAHINYTQTSLGNNIYATKYDPIAQSANFSRRSSAVITMQEFFASCQFQTSYTQQVGLN